MTWLPFLFAACLARAQAPKAPSAISAAAVVEADRLYFHRHQAKNLEDSISFLETQLKACPDQPDLLWRLGRSLLRLGERQDAKSDKLANYVRAEKILRRAVALAPSQPQAHYWLGLAMGRRGQVRGILQSLFLIGPLRREMLTVLKLDPKNGGAHHVLGEMLMEIPAVAGGDKQKGVRELELAARLEPDYSPHFIDLAEAYIAVGQKAKAKAALDHIAAIRSPTDPGEYDENVQDARRMIKKLAD
jgi:tetratricopeptide (TPR) repeat protein